MRVLSILVCLGTALFPCSPPGSAVPAQANHITAVFSALDSITSNHVDKPDPVRLLVGALNGLRKAVASVGVSTRLADLDSANENAARTSFAARSNQALELVKGRLSEDQLAHAAINAMAESLRDKLTDFVTPEELADSRRGGYSGIGVRFRFLSDHWYIWQVFAGGPAARAGIREFDQILAVDGQPVKGLAFADLRNRVRGPEGTVVRLAIRKPGRAAPLQLSITRRLVSPVSIVHGIRRPGVGYVRLTEYVPGVGNEMGAALKDLVRQGMRALVLDLRQSSGGPFSELDQVAELLLRKGLVIYSVAGDQSRTQRTMASPILTQAARLVVLVDADTTLNNELLAAAISQHRRGRLVGVRTAGFGAIGRLVSVAGGGALWIKTGRVLTGKGVPLENNGIRPDVEVRLTADDLERGRDPQLERALLMASRP